MMKFSSKARQLMLQNGDTLWNMVEGADLEMLRKDFFSDWAQRALQEYRQTARKER